MAKSLKVNDTVKVIAGEYKGKVAKVVKIDREKAKAYLEGIEERVRNLKRSYLNPAGGKKTVHLGIHLSNLKLEKAADPVKPAKTTKATKAPKVNKEKGEK